MPLARFLRYCLIRLRLRLYDLRFLLARFKLLIVKVETALGIYQSFRAHDALLVKHKQKGGDAHFELVHQVVIRGERKDRQGHSSVGDKSKAFFMRGRVEPQNGHIAAVSRPVLELREQGTTWATMG